MPSLLCSVAEGPSPPQNSVDAAKPLLRKAIQISQQTPYWHCRLLFQLAVSPGVLDVGPAGCGGPISQGASATLSVRLTHSSCTRWRRTWCRPVTCWAWVLSMHAWWALSIPGEHPGAADACSYPSRCYPPTICWIWVCSSERFLLWGFTPASGLLLWAGTPLRAVPAFCLFWEYSGRRDTTDMTVLGLLGHYPTLKLEISPLSLLVPSPHWSAVSGEEDTDTTSEHRPLDP